MENKIWGSFDEFFLESGIVGHLDEITLKQIEETWNARNAEVEESKNKNTKLQKEIEALTKISKYDTCHRCEHYFGGGARGNYCKSEAENLGCNSPDWKNYSPTSDDKKLASRTLKELKG